MDPEKAVKIFTNAKIASSIFAELPKQKHKGGRLTSIDVPVPCTRLTLEYQTIIDPKIFEYSFAKTNYTSAKKNRLHLQAQKELTK